MTMMRHVIASARAATLADWHQLRSAGLGTCTSRPGRRWTRPSGRRASLVIPHIPSIFYPLFTLAPPVRRGPPPAVARAAARPLAFSSSSSSFCRYGAAAVLDATDPEGRTPLHVAAMRGRKGFVAAAVSLACANRPFTSAAAEQSESAYRAALLARGDGSGMAALHHACFHGRPLTAEWLVEHGASLAATDHKGRTPVETAKVTRRLPPHPESSGGRVLVGEETIAPLKKKPRVLLGCLRSPRQGRSLPSCPRPALALPRSATTPASPQT